MKENHLASPCARTAFSIGYEKQEVRKAFNEGEPPGKHLHEDGVFNRLRRARGPYLVAFNEGEPPGSNCTRTALAIAYEQQGVLIWWHLLKENHLASTCTKTVFSIGYEEQVVLIWWHLMKENHLASTCTRTAFSIGYEKQGVLIWWTCNGGEPPGKHLHEDGVFNLLRRAGGPYLVASNEGEPPGKHLPEDGVFNCLRRAERPYLVAFHEGEPPGKHLHEDSVGNWPRKAGGSLSGGI